MCLSLTNDGRTMLFAEAGTSIESFLTSLGVFAVCAVVGLFMLRRSDARDTASGTTILGLQGTVVELLGKVALLEAKCADCLARLESQRKEP